MSKKIANTFKGIEKSFVKHSPEILTGIGIAGMITTTVLAVKATPKALRLIEKEKQQVVKDLGTSSADTVKLSVGDTIKATWKCYIPAAITGAASIACLIGASSVHLKRNAALAAAYKLSETALVEYKDKVVEVIGEKKEKKIRDELAKDKLEKAPANTSNVIITGKGDTLCMDYYTGRKFKSDIEKIKKAVNEINRRMTYDHYVSVNDFYNEIGLDGIGLGSELGWNLDGGLLEIYPSAQLDSDGTPCLVITFNIEPKYEFDRFL